VKYGLAEHTLSAIVDVLSNNEKVSDIVLFGSRAKGTFRPGSDIDIALKGTGLTMTDLIRFRGALDDLVFPYKLDLVIYDKIKEPALLDHINRIGILLSIEG